MSLLPHATSNLFLLVLQPLITRSSFHCISLDMQVTSFLLTYRWHRSARLLFASTSVPGSTAKNTKVSL